jgi:beta-galactosidase
VEGGSLMGIFSGDPKNDDRYGSNACHAFEGRAVAIVRTNTPGQVRITVISDGLAAGSASVTAE